MTHQMVLQAANAIRLMYDDRGSDTNNLNGARQLISDADCVVFLGFSFDQNNVALLTLSKLCQSKAIFACRFREPDGNYERMRSRMHPTAMPDRGQVSSEWDSLDLLQQTLAIR